MLQPLSDRPTGFQKIMPAAETLRERYSDLAHLYEPLVLRHALRLCGGNLDWASDLTQDALISGFRLALENKLDFEGNVKAWFMRVVTTRFINEFRRNKKWTADVPIETVDDLGGGSAPLNPEDTFVEQVLEEPLDRALQQLPEEQRICVLLIDIEELSYAEASELLHVPVGTVRSRLARGRLRLYTLLIPYAKAKGILKP